MNYEIIDKERNYEVKKKYWNIAVGLQDVDGLKPSPYLKELAEKNIIGELSNSDIETLLYAKYESESAEQRAHRLKECDIVSNRIVELLEMDGMVLSPSSLKAIHRYLFHGLYENAGEYRTYNISKREPILNGETVKYANFYMIEDTLNYDFTEERSQKYVNKNSDYVINRISQFTSSIWQVHPFSEGNTRTTAVFIERYLNNIGFNVNNSLFKDNAKFFRNALVRSNYANYTRGIDTNDSYLKEFFDNLLYGGRHLLRSRDLIIKDLLNAPEE